MQKAVFLDRDGTIIKDAEYLKRKEDIIIEDEVIDGLKELQAHNYLLIVVTNQSGIARGYFSIKKFLALQRYILNVFEKKGVKIDDFYFCPHHPLEGNSIYTKKCYCRKPSPGMLIKGISDFNIEPTKSFMIGDKLDDVIAGQRAGLKSILLSENPSQEVKYGHNKPDFLACNFYSAVHDYILKND